MNRCRIILGMIFLVVFAAVLRGDTLTLNDGSTVEGKVISQGEKYWVKLPDNTTKYIKKSDVKSWTKAEVGKGTATAGGAAAGTVSANASASPSGASSANVTVTPAAQPSPGSSSVSFAAVRAKAEGVDSPVLAVQVWQKFVDSKPPASELDAANVELAKWQKLQKDNAEKIGGKWVGGDERKELLKKVDGLVKEGITALTGDQTIEGTKKLEEALKIYPNSFEANYGMGYIYLVKGAVGATGRGNVAYQEKAVKSLETASKLRPTSAGAWSNLAIAYNFRSRYQESVEAAYKAVKIEDSKETVGNLVNSIAHAPPAMQTNNGKLKPIIEDAFVLAGKRGIDRKGGLWTYIPPLPPSEHAITPSEIAGEGKPGPAWRGSGFFVSTDGYIITNHHVATGKHDSPVLKNISFLVRLDDGTQKNAELIAVDDKADIALMKIKSDSPLSFLKIANDNPKQAAQALVLGYPVTGLDEPSLQVSAGDVASINVGDSHEVWLHLDTTHGNSGGPIVDKNGRLIAILTGGRTVYNVTYVLGVGPNQIKNFLAALGEKAPKLEYAPVGTGEFNGEALTEQARKATVLITAIRGGEQTSSNVAEVSGAATSQPAAP